MNKKIYYKINCSNLGDALCSTPVVRKLSKLYNTKLNIINDTPEVFRNNPYVDKIISCNYFDVKNIYGDYEFFESFVLPGKKINLISKENLIHSILDKSMLWILVFH